MKKKKKKYEYGVGSVHVVYIHLYKYHIIILIFLRKWLIKLYISMKVNHSSKVVKVFMKKGWIDLKFKNIIDYFYLYANNLFLSVLFKITVYRKSTYIDILSY